MRAKPCSAGLTAHFCRSIRRLGSLTGRETVSCKEERQRGDRGSAKDCWDRDGVGVSTVAQTGREIGRQIGAGPLRDCIRKVAGGEESYALLFEES